jgi:hypothetical protein
VVNSTCFRSSLSQRPTKKPEEPKFREISASLQITSSRTVPDAAVTAAKLFRAELLSDIPKGSQKKRDQCILDHGFEVLIAFYFEKRPYFFRFNFQSNYAAPDTTGMVAIGSPDLVARFIARGADFRSFPMEQVMAAAASIVVKCIEFDSGCDFPIQIGTINLANGDTHDAWPKSVLESYEEAARSADKAAKGDLVDRAYDYYIAQISKELDARKIRSIANAVDPNAPLPPS